MIGGHVAASISKPASRTGRGGLPVIFQSLSVIANGTLIGPQGTAIRANYGLTNTVNRTVRIEPSE